jgi:hypothetical protein
MMVRRPCGCPCAVDCTISHDDFAGSGSIGAEWDSPVSGSWSRVSGELVTSSANAKILNSRMASFAMSTFAVTVRSNTAGAQAKIFFFHNADNSAYLWVRWEFGASDGILTIWKHVTGVDTQQENAGPFLDDLATFTFPGRGAGVATRISCCGVGGQMTVYVDDGHGFRSPPLCCGSGPRAGLGTGATGGDVAFDDVEWDHSDLAKPGCEHCEPCQTCDDQQTICVHVSGIAIDDFAPADVSRCSPHPTCSCPVIFNGDHVLARFGCVWAKSWTATNDIFTLIVVAYRDEADQHYYLEAQFWYPAGSTTYSHVPFRQIVARFRADLGLDNPDCGNWDGLELPWYALHQTDCNFEDVLVTVSSGEQCSGSTAAQADPCCQTVTLPGTVYLNATGYGATPDTPLLGGHVGVNIFYNGNDSGAAVSLYEFVCSPQGGGQPPYVALFIYFIGAATAVEVPMTIDSCDPFHAEGDYTPAGYHVEISA